MKNSRGRTARGEVDFTSFESYAGIARGKGAFAAQSRGHVIRWKRIPVLPVGGLQQKEFAVNRIAEGKALFFRKAGDGVEENFFAIVRVLEIPSFAAVRGFVDAGFVAFAAGHDIGGFLAESHDAAKIQRIAIFNAHPLPSLAFIEGFENHAVRTGSPDDRQ